MGMGAAECRGRAARPRRARMGLYSAPGVPRQPAALGNPAGWFSGAAGVSCPPRGGVARAKLPRMAHWASPRRATAAALPALPVPVRRAVIASCGAWMPVISCCTWKTAVGSTSLPGWRTCGKVSRSRSCCRRPCSIQGPHHSVVGGRAAAKHARKG